jgi:hypothetical protein
MYEMLTGDPAFSRYTIALYSLFLLPLFIFVDRIHQGLILMFLQNLHLRFASDIKNKNRELYRKIRSAQYNRYVP